MVRYVTMAIITALLTPAQAALKSEGKTHLSISNPAKTATLTIDKGFHFNKEAPKFLLNQNKKIAPSLLSEAKLEFQWTGDLASDAKIQYYVCDDAKTVCEPHTENLGSLFKKTAALAPATQSIAAAKSQGTKTNLKSSQKDSEGFFVNDLSAAQKEAADKKALLLIDFTASWCPACIRLIHESFMTKTFKSASKPYVKVKIDVDLERHHELLEKYSIHAFPTLVITDAQGNELERFLDFVPANVLAAQLKAISQNPPVAIEQLKAKALAGDVNARLNLGKNAFRAQQTQECIDWLSPLSSKPQEYYLCSIDHAEELQASPEELKTALEGAIQAFPESFYSIDWRMRLAKVLKSTNKTADSDKTLSEAETLIGQWLKEPSRIQKTHAQGELLELQDLVLPELYYSLGTIYESRGQKDEAKKQFEMAIEKTLALQPSVKNPTIVLYLVQYMKKTRPTDETLSWLKKLEQAYPEDFTYLQRQASLLSETKAYSQALPIAEKAYSLSYGTNQLKTGFLLSKIQLELNKKQEAKELLKNLINSKSAQAKSNKHHLEKLSKAYGEIR